jgi:hypothetical protein
MPSVRHHGLGRRHPILRQDVVHDGGDGCRQIFTAQPTQPNHSPEPLAHLGRCPPGQDMRGVDWPARAQVVPITPPEPEEVRHLSG